VQNRLIVVGVVHFVLLLIVIASALLIPLMARLGVESEYDPEVISAARQFMELHYRLWPPLFLTLALLVLHNIIVTHRIAGPLWRIRRELAAIGNGDLSRSIRIRPTDYMSKEADAVNSMVSSLRAKVERVDERHQTAAAALARLEDAAHDNSKERFDTAIDDLRVSLGSALDALSEFETSRPPQVLPEVRDPEFEVVP
jgi:methyl-accepting chemotaxis protein